MMMTMIRMLTIMMVMTRKGDDGGEDDDDNDMIIENQVIYNQQLPANFLAFLSSLTETIV